MHMIGYEIAKIVKKMCVHIGRTLYHARTKPRNYDFEPKVQEFPDKS